MNDKWRFRMAWCGPSSYVFSKWLLSWDAYAFSRHLRVCGLLLQWYRWVVLPSQSTSDGLLLLPLLMLSTTDEIVCIPRGAMVHITTKDEDYSDISVADIEEAASLLNKEQG